ncbi:MAG TPA: hypothetical protein VHC63_13270 [Acidimicrobiales bacterium]|nr:hypothetical protein [Acidimicrobiales bacterium]
MTRKTAPLSIRVGAWLGRRWKLVPHAVTSVAALASLPFVHGHVLDVAHVAIVVSILLGVGTYAAPANNPPES